MIIFKQTLLILLFWASLVFSQVGTDAADFNLDKLGGGNEKLSDHSGKIVYIFWFGYSCPKCIALAPTTKNIVNSYSNLELKAFGIDVWDGSSGQVQNFKDQTGIQYDLLLKGSSTLSAYSASREESCIIDKNGVIQYLGNTNESAIKNKIDQLLNPTIITENLKSPIKFELKNNYPNPFNPETQIPFSVNKTQNIKLEIYNVAGKLVRTLINATFAKGNYEVTWNGTDNNSNNVASGLYFSRLEGENINKVKQLVLIK